MTPSPSLPQERKVREAEEKLRQEEATAAAAVGGGGGTESVQFVKGTGGTGQPLVNYPSLDFTPSCLFAVGSPIGLFLSLRYLILNISYFILSFRGVESLGPEYQLPTCPAVFNIFHPVSIIFHPLCTCIYGCIV